VQQSYGLGSELPAPLPCPSCRSQSARSSMASPQADDIKRALQAGNVFHQPRLMLSFTRLIPEKLAVRSEAPQCFTRDFLKVFSRVSLERLTYCRSGQPAN